MNRWEYLVVALPPFRDAHVEQGASPAVDILNSEGQQGWEAIGVTALDDGRTAVLMKRRVRHRRRASPDSPGFT